jgi:hypothetical protein
MMKLKRNKRLIWGTGFAIIFIILISTACTQGTVEPQDKPLITSVQAIEPISSPTPTLYPEPSTTPTGLPSSVKWDPYRNAWYDSSQVELDPVTHMYKSLPFTVPPDYTPPKVASITPEEWIVQHRNSTNEVDIAIIKYYEELTKYLEIKRLDPDWMARSSIDIGQGEGGPLTILTDLGIPKLQRLVDYVQWENPFVWYLEAVTDRIMRRTLTSGLLGHGDTQVNAWKQDFNDQASNAKSKVDGIDNDLVNNTADDKTIKTTFSRLGIFALPEVYELVINQGNTRLIKYLPDILPLDKMKSYNIKSGETDETILKQALQSCSEEIKIIQTLHAN